MRREKNTIQGINKFPIILFISSFKTNLENHFLKILYIKTLSLDFYSILFFPFKLIDIMKKNN